MGPGGWGGAGLGYGGFGGFGMGPGGWGGFGGGGGGNGPGGRGGRGQMDPEMAERFAAMGEAMNELQQGSEAALAKILEKGQYTRLKQVQLQIAGTPALLQPEMIEKLLLSEEQVEQIRELINEGRQAMRENGRAYGEMMRDAFPAPADNGQNANNAPNGQNGQNGGNNGRGGGRRGPNMRDPAVQAAMKTYMDKPETKAKIEQMKAQNDKLQNQLVSAVNRALSKRQLAAYKKMLGPVFDMAKLTVRRGRRPGLATVVRTRRTPRRRPPRRRRRTMSEAPTAKPAAKAKSSTSTAKAKRKSLREQRGLDE